MISRGDRPVARLVPIDPPTAGREPGTGKGEIWIADDFNAPLPDDLLEGIEASLPTPKRKPPAGKQRGSGAAGSRGRGPA